jgi:hypothetical protein
MVQCIKNRQLADVLGLQTVPNLATNTGSFFGKFPFLRIPKFRVPTFGSLAQQLILLVWLFAGGAGIDVRFSACVRHWAADAGAEPHTSHLKRVVRGRTALGRWPQPHQLHQLGMRSVLSNFHFKFLLKEVVVFFFFFL